MGEYLDIYNVPLEEFNGYCGGMFRMDYIHIFPEVYYILSILWWKILNINNFPWRCLPGNRFLVVIIVNGDTRRLTTGFDQVQLVF